MKKTLLLFAMLLGVVGAWAQEDTFVTPEAGKYYIIKGLSPTAPYLGKSNTDGAFSVVASESDAGIFYVEASNTAGKYYMTCVNATSTTQFFGHNGDVRLVDQKRDVTLEAATDGKYYIAVGNNWMHNNKGNSIGTGTKDATPQNQWGFIEAPLNTAPEITLTNVQPNGDRLTLYVDDNNTLTFSASSPTELGAKAKFAYTVINEKYVFFNKSKNCYLIWRGYTSGGFNSNKGTLSYYNDTYCKWTLATGTKDGVSCFRLGGTRNDNTYGSLILLTATGTKNYRFDAYGNNDGYTLNNNNNQYSNWFTVQVNCSLYNEELESKFKWMYETNTFATDPKPTITGIVGATLDEEFFNGGCEYSAKVTFPFPVSSETKINPTMISSFKGDSHQADGSFLWYADNGIVKIKKHVEASNSGRKVASEKNIISYLWALYPECENGVFSVGIWNIGAGNYISISPETEYDNGKGSANEAEDLKLENEKVTQFNVAANNAFYHTISGKEHRLSFGSINNNSGNLGVYVKNHGGTYNSFHTPAITTQISDAKYSTICLPFAAKLPEGVEAYSIETVNATYATLTPKEGLPANTGAILKAEEPGYYTFIQTEDEIDTWDYNLLYGSVEDIYWYGDGYVLSKKDEVVALYKAELNYILNEGVPEKVTEGGKYFKNNAGKALLPTTSLIADARFLVFGFGDDMETGITETENGHVKTENDELYDLSGRRVQGAQKGIFIVNGKKVVR